MISMKSSMRSRKSSTSSAPNRLPLRSEKAATRKRLAADHVGVDAGDVADEAGAELMEKVASEHPKQRIASHETWHPPSTMTTKTMPKLKSFVAANGADRGVVAATTKKSAKAMMRGLAVVSRATTIRMWPMAGGRVAAATRTIPGVTKSHIAAAVSPPGSKPYRFWST